MQGRIAIRAITSGLCRVFFDFRERDERVAKLCCSPGSGSLDVDPILFPLRETRTMRKRNRTVDTIYLIFHVDTRIGAASDSRRAEISDKNVADRSASRLEPAQMHTRICIWLIKCTFKLVGHQRYLATIFLHQIPQISTELSAAGQPCSQTIAKRCEDVK